MGSNTQHCSKTSPNEATKAALLKTGLLLNVRDLQCNLKLVPSLEPTEASHVRINMLLRDAQITRLQSF